MSKFTARFLPLLLVACLHTGGAQAQQRTPDLKLGNAVVTGFSGTIAPDPNKKRPRGTSVNDLTFINPNGASARIVDISKPGYVWDGRLFQAPKTFDILAKDVGQVFGVALDGQTPPNIYVAATSVFGLNIVSRGRGGLPERRVKGGPGAGWMKGQFGLDLQGGPGGIYMVDGRTGAVTLFANVTLDGVPNPGPALGNLAYDSEHKQLFVSDLYTGMIHRLDLDGKDLGHYDHGVTGLAAAKIAIVAFDPKKRPNIASERFNSEKPDTWDYAPAARRVWGLAVHGGRLYYSVASGPQIWSVGINRDGSFAADPRWELDVPAQAGPLPVSDIAFSHQGAMILAQRALIAGAYDYSAFTRPGEPQVFRIWPKGPKDPPSPGRWKLLPEEYAIGFAGEDRNANGGVALGYGYGKDGTLNTAACEAALWTTGQNLRNNPALRSELEPGGPLVVHGLQGSPANLVRNANTPPKISYFVDYDNKFDDPKASGHLGSVRIYTTPCAPAAYVPLVVAAFPIATPIGCVGPNCRSACTPTCVCPPGTELKGKECVKIDACPPPQVMNQAHECVCPQGTKFVDGKCVPIEKSQTNSCPPPMIQIIGGPCVCPPGTTLVDGACVPDAHKCAPPLVPGETPGSCVCPNNGVLLNGKCVPRVCPSPLVPGPCECPQGSIRDGNECVKTTPIDLGVKKTGGTTPQWDVGAYDFMIDVTNHGAPFTGTNIITVTDVVPAGMKFNTAFGTNWTCVTLPASAGQTITCTYTGTGTIATNQALPTITIDATALDPPPFPPYTNCATVGVMPGSGYTDSDPGNNNDCVTVTKPGGTGSITVQKVAVYVGPILLPSQAYPIIVTCGSSVTNLSVVPGTPQTVNNIPLGTSCTISEGTVTTPPNVCPPNTTPTWTTGYAPPSPIIVNGSTITETVTNTLTCNPAQGGTGVLNVQKDIDCSSIGCGDPEFIVFPVVAHCGGTDYPLNLSVYSNPSVVTNLPLGTQCTITEDVSSLPPAPGSQCPAPSVPTWSVTYSPPSVTIGTTPVLIRVHNVETCTPPQGGSGSLIVKKVVVNHSPLALPSMTFPVTVTCGGTATNLDLASDGTPQTVNGITTPGSCTVQEGTITTPPNACPQNTIPAWTTTYAPPSPVSVTGAGATMTIQNVLDCERGGHVVITKVIDNQTTADVTGISFPAVVTCNSDTFPTTLSASSPQVLHNKVIGSVCSVVETLPPAPTTGCPEGSVPTWMTPPTYTPATTTIVAGSGAALTVNNVLFCKQAPEGIPACDANSTTRKDKMCSCRFEHMVHTSPTMCMCMQGMKLQPGKGCVPRLDCTPPLVPDAAGTKCVCPDGEVLRRGKCVKQEQPKREKTCKRGFVWNGDMCVRKKREEPRVKRDDIIRALPGLIPGLGGRGNRSGGGGGAGGGGKGGAGPVR